MWESFNQLPLWLKAIIIIVPAGILIGLSVAIFIKILKAERIKIGQAELEDKDAIDKSEVNHERVLVKK